MKALPFPEGCNGSYLPLGRDISYTYHPSKVSTTAIITYLYYQETYHKYVVSTVMPQVLYYLIIPVCI